MKRRTQTNRIIIHYSRTEGGDVEFMRDIHLKKNYSEVGYHFVICNGKPWGDWPAGGDGEVQEGRDLWRQGAHAYNRQTQENHNEDSVGICLIGCFGTRLPTDRQLTALIELLTRLCVGYGLDPLTAIIAHRDVCDTDCPGDHFYSVMAPPLKMLQYAVYYRMKIMEGGE